MLLEQKPFSLVGKNILNVGLSHPHKLPSFLNVKTAPIIQIEKKHYSQEELAIFQTHAMNAESWIFSSKTAVKLFLEAFPKSLFQNKKAISVGVGTTQELKKYGVHTILQAKEESQEGLLQIILEQVSLQSALFWPHSMQARAFLSEELQKAGYKLFAMPLYAPLPDLALHPMDLKPFDAILFTSPSTLDAFQEIYGEFPKDKTVLCIGKITYQKALVVIKNSCEKALPEILMLGEVT